VNAEINKKFLEIRRKCFKGHPEKYPGYCKRAVLDILSLLNDIREEIAELEQKQENIIYFNQLNTAASELATLEELR